MYHPDRCYARGIRLPNCRTYFLLTGQVGINILIKVSCQHQLLQMGFQHVVVFGHVVFIFVVRALKLLILHGQVFYQFWWQKKKGFPFYFIHDFINWLFEDCLEHPKRRSHIIRRIEQVFSGVVGSNRRFGYCNLGLGDYLNRSDTSPILLNSNKLIYSTH